jgi:hypothetical protein
MSAVAAGGVWNKQFEDRNIGAIKKTEEDQEDYLQLVEPEAWSHASFHGTNGGSNGDEPKG